MRAESPVHRSTLHIRYRHDLMFFRALGHAPPWPRPVRTRPDGQPVELRRYVDFGHWPRWKYLASYVCRRWGAPGSNHAPAIGSGLLVAGSVALDVGLLALRPSTTEPSAARHPANFGEAREWATRGGLAEVAAHRGGVRIEQRRALHGQPNGNRFSRGGVSGITQNGRGRGATTRAGARFSTSLRSDPGRSSFPHPRRSLPQESASPPGSAEGPSPPRRASDIHARSRWRRTRACNGSQTPSSLAVIARLALRHGGATGLSGVSRTIGRGPSESS